MTLFKKSLLGGLAVFALTACQAKQPGTLYYGFTQIDPATETVTPNAWIVVEGERIKSLGAEAPPLGDYKEAKDMTGLYALPGLIDAHAHITAGPHKFELIDGAPTLTIESQDDVTVFNARTALAFGITTVRNPGGSTDANHKYDKNIADGTWIGPEAFHAGAVIQPPPMGGNAFTYPQTPDEWKAEAQHQADMGMRYFKLYVSLSEEELDQGITAAHDAGLKAIAHLDGISWKTAADLGIDGLEHAIPTSTELLEPDALEIYNAEKDQTSKYLYRWFELVDYDSPNFLAMKQSLVDNQVELNFNFLVNHLIFTGDEPEIDETWKPYFYPESLEAAQGMLAMSLTGWTTEDFKRSRAVFPKVLEFGKIMHDAGLPIMIGTDSAGGTPYYAMEMDLHVDAGIPAWDVLKMATSATAEILEISDRTGRIEPGLEADLVFLKASPLDDMENIAKVEMTVTNGEAYSFDELTESGE